MTLQTRTTESNIRRDFSGRMDYYANNGKNKKNKPVNLPVNIQLYKTTDYSQFKFIDFNRQLLKESELTKLQECIERSNFLSIMPIIVNKKMEVTDGQRRLKVAMRLKKPVYFIKSELITVDNLMDGNMGVGAWKVTDYIHYYSARGYDDYQLLAKYMEDQRLPASTSLMIIYNYAGRTFELNERLKLGKFKIENYQEALERTKKIFDFSKYIDWYRHKSFVCAVLFIMQNNKYNHKRMLKKMAYNSRRLVKCGDVEGFLKMLEDLYNHNTKLENKVRFFGE